MEDQQPDEPVTIEVRDLARVHLNPGDVLVVKPERRLSHEQCVRISAELKDVFPDNRVIVTPELDLAVVTTEPTA